jgi:F420-dependent oxidoreductase-like protein
MQIFAGEIRFGIHSGPQHTSYEDYLALWKAAEELGYDWASVFDHFVPIMSDPEGPCFEGLTLLAAMAAHTERIRCGILVVGNTYRHPAVLANIATTLDHVSGGRLELGVGAGWWEMEHEEYGITLPPIGKRIRMLGETLPILKSLWTEQRTTFEGRYYQLTNALCEPKPVQQPHIPLWVGGAGEKLTLRAVAESADGWNTFYMPLDEYQRKLDALAGHCRAVGRDPGDIRKSLVLQAIVRRDEAEAEERLARMARAMNTTPDAARQRALVGTPAQCVEQLLPYVGAGVGDFIVGVRAPVDWESLELVAKEVAPAVKERGSCWGAGE